MENTNELDDTKFEAEFGEDIAPKKRKAFLNDISMITKTNLSYLNSTSDTNDNLEATIQSLLYESKIDNYDGNLHSKIITHILENGLFALNEASFSNEIVPTRLTIFINKLSSNSIVKNCCFKGNFLVLGII